MKGPGPLLRGLAGLLLVAATVAPTAAFLRRPAVTEPGVCINPGCSCGVHVPGVKCCCAPEEPVGPREGLYKATCCGRKESDPPIPAWDRLAILPGVLAELAPPLRRLSDREHPLAPSWRPGDPPDHVPRIGT